MKFNLLYRNINGADDKQSRYNSYVHQWNEIVHVINECTESAFPELKSENMMGELADIESKLKSVVKREGLKDEVESILPFKGFYYGR